MKVEAISGRRNYFGVRQGSRFAAELPLCFLPDHFDPVLAKNSFAWR